MTSILEQARQEGRMEARQTLSLLSSMEREEEYEKGKEEGWFEARRANKRWERFHFLFGLAVTVLFYELVLYP